MPTEIDVSRVYFINLASRTDRLEHMHRQLKGCPWPVERVEAVRLDQDPRELGYEVLPRLQGQWHFVGIWLSHMRALENAMEHGEPGAIIVLEDDVRIRPDLWATRLSLSAKVAGPWDIIFLSPRYRQNTNGKTMSHSKVRKWVKVPFGTQPVLLQSIRSSFVCTGAHFCIFHDLDTVRKVVSLMKECPQLCDVDLFYLSQFRTYGLDDPRISTAALGTDHG